MKKKSMIILTIILMSIGFAAVSTTLVINGNAKVSENEDDFSVIFTAASLDGKDVYSTVVDDTKKTINFTTPNLSKVGDKSTLIYEITNNSSQYDAEVKVTCVPKDGAAAKYTSIKNKLDNDATKVTSKRSINGTLTITLDKTPVEEATEEYICKLEFNAVERETIAESGTNLYNLIKNNADTTTVIDYSIRSGATGKETNGIYTTTATVGNIPVYYYRGQVDNNIIFNNMCWKIIRTTETGGVKLIYNGVPENGTCKNTGEASQIGTSAFNESSNDNAYVGYMYGTAGSSTYEATHANINDSTIKTYIDNWYKNNFTEEETNQLEDTVYCNDRSMISGGNNNTLGTSYGTIGYGKNSTGYGVLKRSTYFTIKVEPSLVCQNENDKFTTKTENGNGALTYSVGLITLDETILAGFNTHESNSNDYNDVNNYLNTGFYFWTMSPAYFTEGEAYVGHIRSTAYIDSGRVFTASPVRPVVSLKSNSIVSLTGNGTENNPYKVI